RQVLVFPDDAPFHPGGHPFKHRENGIEHIYFATPYPLLRVPATFDALQDLSQYEAWTCLASGSTLDAPEIDRDEDGRLRYAWRHDAPPMVPAVQQKLIEKNLIKRDEARPRLRDAESGKPVFAHAGSVAWNDYRRKWVMVFVEQFGTSLLGEVWYAEADSPVGPWERAVKIATHEKYSFYNPKHHPFFDQEGGRVIYFEGTYSHTFSGNADRTPRYDYNQVMYRLDLSDLRLRAAE
ncbi:MAG: DUF4185 domain-containing protein, partial [Gemmatimonadetes bacterium]|nr:DUF4185 domain-containing protein [Gemmatimonadota bacterium]